MRCTAALLLAGLVLAPAASAAPPMPADQVRCRTLAVTPGVAAAVWHPAGLVVPGQFGDFSPPLPAHCEVTGALDPRTAPDGQRYAIGFRMRLPAAWNGRFLFSGGGGSNGSVNAATGAVGLGNAPALLSGYAVIAQDSGHDNALNSDPARGGVLVFGHDPVARRNYGHASLPRTAAMAHRLLRQFYRRDAAHSYFYGCSKGGQEGMMLAQRYPRLFDGIVAAAPGFSLPKAAVAQAWSVQQLARLTGGRSAAELSRGFSPADFALARETVLATCDRDDGAADGLLGAVGLCTSARLRPAFAARTCREGQTAECLPAAKVDALFAIMGGPRNRAGQQLYAEFPWDAGVGLDGWSAWVSGSPGQPSRNITLGLGSLAAVFTSPPTALPTDTEALLRWGLVFDFDNDAAKIFARAPGSKTSAWQDIGARSANLDAFAAHGGRLIVPHGMADPVFSANDTMAWWDELNVRMRGRAATTARVFPVPGMNHCGGGDATDRFDAFAALVDWVEHGKAPEAIPAATGSTSRWSGRTRPLCAWPSTLRYKGSGNIDDAANFACVAPGPAAVLPQ